MMGNKDYLSRGSDMVVVQISQGNFAMRNFWILCQNSLTRELKIRVVGFVLKKL